MAIDERPCIYKHTCGFEICTLSECTEYVAKTRSNKWFEESEDGKGYYGIEEMEVKI